MNIIRLNMGTLQQWAARLEALDNDQEAFQKDVQAMAARRGFTHSGDTRSTLLEQERKESTPASEKGVPVKQRWQVPSRWVQRVPVERGASCQEDLNKPAPQKRKLQHITVTVMRQDTCM
ncbi:hypothetical protein GWK47_003556 [Chionoecetes opilio]|uniref:Uncharacterized protein n=1 Tax=Chionoecetes opilio TaxID=41210 RepID=A0A8J5CQW3_CHIOP|nr:hypothetical protein GWK47_003556 [Chionoecetes opilio]